MGDKNGNGTMPGREVLPIPNEEYAGPVLYNANDPAAVFPPIQEIRPPQGAPNVLVVLIDDAGFGASSAFGGPINTPVAERLAANGLKYNRFHTTALCSPTRAALLTGRNHHSVGMGAITELAAAAPGYTSMIPNNKAAVAKILRDNGYSTAQFGKCHEVPVWETSPMGPFEHWPTMQGFEKFYGFVGGETNQWFPEVFDNLTRVEVPNDPSYHFTEDMASKAIDWIKAQKAIYPDKPFFIYWAPGATHAPHQVPAEWIEKYKGKFDDGWDKLRERTFARQKELGVIPADAELTPRPEQIPAWDDMPEELKPILRRQMETYAGFLEHTDHNVGKLVDILEQAEILDDTLIYYIIGDNGASAEGTLNGTFNEMINFNGVPELETPEFLMEHIDDWGGRDSYRSLRGRLGARHGHPVSVDQAGGLALGRHAQRHDRPLAARHQSERGDPLPVPPRHRRGADHPGSRRPAGAGLRRGHPAVADGRRQHALQLQRRQRRGPAHHPVLRDVRQPRHLLRRLDGGDPPLHPVGAVGEVDPLRRRRLGAVRHQHRLDAGAQPGGGKPRQAGRSAAAVHHRGGPLPGPAAGRPPRRAHDPRHGRPADADQGGHAGPLPRHGDGREQRRRHQEQVLRGDRQRRTSGEGRGGRDHRPGRQLRRLGDLRPRGAS